MPVCVTTNKRNPGGQFVFGVLMSNRKCPGCGKNSDESDFRSNKPTAKCSPCRKRAVAAFQRYKARDPQHVLEIQRRSKAKYRERYLEQAKKKYYENLEERRAKDREQSRERRARDPEKSRQKQRDQYRNSPKKKASLKSYRERNREKVLARKREWYQRNRDKIVARVRAWREKNPTRNNLLRIKSNHTRRAKVSGNGGSFTPQEWDWLMNLCGNRCVKCGATNTKIERDHIVPITRGGQSNIENIQPLCEHCNRTKFNKIADYRPKWIVDNFGTLKAGAGLSVITI